MSDTAYTALLNTIVCQPSIGQDAIPAASLLENVDFLQQVDEQAHTGFYRYNTKARMAERFAALLKEFDRDRGLGESDVAVSSFLARIRCNLSYANV
ncbi:MAG: hypothetical protein U0800_09485 [Isosphaeraceae bacterium]